MTTKSKNERLAADRLAYACAQAIIRGHIGSRSEIADAVLDYLDVGGICGPADVHAWVDDYERRRAAENAIRLAANRL